MHITDTAHASAQAGQRSRRLCDRGGNWKHEMRQPDEVTTFPHWSPAFLAGARLEEVRTEYEVLQLLRRCASHFGFGHFLVARLPVGDRRQFSERLVISSWPTDLVRGYDDLDIYHESRLATEVAQTKRPFLGDGSLLAPKDPGPAADAAAALAERHELAVSLAFLLHTTAGEPFAMVFSGSEPPRAGDELAQLYFAAVQLFACLEQTFVRHPVVKDKLSGREIECLRWAAAGKSSDEIAIILGISAYTVSSYFKSAAKKLGAVNRMQAIASAMRMKLI